MFATDPVDAPTAPDSPSGTLFFRRYSPYVAAIAYRLLGADSEVDDVVQDVFLAALGGLSQLRDPGAVKGWLATVTVRTVRRRLRVRRMKAWLGFDDVANFNEPIAAQASAEQQVLLHQVYRALDGSPVEQRLAWTLRHVQGETLEEVARLTDCSLATAKRRVAAAQTAIEAALTPRLPAEPRPQMHAA
jgi:RNA polymerase sigma-70 factor (ECF subfamily)